MVLAAGSRLPDGAIGRMLRAATGGLEVALCLHRVGPSRPGEPLPWMSIPEASLDRFLELARGVHLTLAFDDGYADAVSYVRARAPRYPAVDFVLFVCPEKLARRTGFRWDRYELRIREGADPGRLPAFVHAPADPARENQRADLEGLADRPEFALATVEECLAAAALPNVRLGNHGNTHLRLAALDRADAVAELTRSVAAFEAIFGPTCEFAFPFGVPGRDFDQDHVRILADLGTCDLWSTEPRPFFSQERGGGGVLPRFPVMGGLHPKALAMWVAAASMGHGGSKDSVLDEIAAGPAG